MSIWDRFRLDGKRAFLTGGSRGLGREMALALAEAGADVCLAGRNQESLDRTAKDIRELGRRVWTVSVDMSVPELCEAACETILQEQGCFDILVNNVGGRRESIPTEQMPLATWQRLIDFNLTSTFLCTKWFGGAMVERGHGGRIINISSINAFVAGPGIQGRHYETSKAAIVQFTRATAVDWAKYGITVNAICPGPFLTEPNVRWSETHPDVINRIREQVPLGDFGAPEDLGPLAVYLASDASRFMTGAALILDGGYTLM
ncbi:MAG: SDR family oxidoreductase [Planctomycetaceae bacterium]|nr:SDR family oxidoreductase [Planctomycetaceae bacterium]